MLLIIGYGSGSSLAINPFMFSMLAVHLAILTLSAYKLKNAIKPTVTKVSIQFNSELEKTGESGTAKNSKLKSSVAESSGRTKNESSVV